MLDSSHLGGVLCHFCLDPLNQFEGIMTEPDLSPAEGPVLTVEAQIEKLKSGDAGERYYAAWWLGRMRIREGIPVLIQALQDPERTPAGAYTVRRNAARALAKLADQVAISALLDCVDSDDPQFAAAAIQALGECVLTHSQAQATVETALVNRLQHLNQSGLDSCNASLLEALLETLGLFASQAARPLIEPCLNHRSLRVNSSAARALYLITKDPQYIDPILVLLSHDNIHLRRAALLDLGATGYVSTAPTIANAAVETNIKLLALKTLLDAHMHQTGGIEASINSLLQILDALI